MLKIKPHTLIIIILLLALLSIALVWWVFEKRLERLNPKVKTTSFIPLIKEFRQAI